MYPKASILITAVGTFDDVGLRLFDSRHELSLAQTNAEIKNFAAKLAR
jgi:hypothetical protein